MSFFKKCIFLFVFVWLNTCEAKIIASGIYEHQDKQQAVVVVQQTNTLWQTIAPWAKNENVLASGMLQINCDGSNLCAASGWYENRHDLKETGFIFTSKDAGKNWQIINPFINIPDFQFAYLPGVKCIHDKCMVVGDYVAKDQSQSNAIIFSTIDRGTTWQTEIPFGPSSSLTAVDCIDKNCISVGSHDNKPIIVIKEGTKPSVSVDIVGHLLHDISCNDQICVAIGLNDLLISYDKGHHWNKVLSAEDMSFYSIHCQNMMCIATTKLIVTNQFSFFITKDAGKSWMTSTPAFPINISKIGFLSSVKCAANFCVSVGSYETPASNTQGVILISHDKGESWQFIFPYENMTDIKYSFLTRVGCESKTCTAVGDFYGIDSKGSFKNQAAIWVSDENGMHWKFDSVLADKQFANIDSISVINE